MKSLFCKYAYNLFRMSSILNYVNLVRVELSYLMLSTSQVLGMSNVFWVLSITYTLVQHNSLFWGCLKLTMLVLLTFYISQTFSNYLTMLVVFVSVSRFLCRLILFYYIWHIALPCIHQIRQPSYHVVCQAKRKNYHLCTVTLYVVGQ